MARVPLLLIALSSFIFSISALDVRGKIQWNEVCPSIGALGSSKVVLDDGRLAGGVTFDGSFLIPDVPAGTYVLSVLSHDYLFDQLRIDVFDSSSTPEARPYVPGTPLNPPSTILLSHPIILAARQKNVYFVPPDSFNLIVMFQNPMMIMMVMAGVMVLALPYITQNLDPEAMEEFKEQHAKMTNMQNAMASGDLKSGLSALLAGGNESTNVAASTSLKAQAAQNKHRGNRNKRR